MRSDRAPPSGLNEAEPVLVSLPLSIRQQLPATSRVRPPCGWRLASLDPGLPELSAADRIKLSRLAWTLAEIVALDTQIKDLGEAGPRTVERPRLHPDPDPRHRRGHRHGPAHRGPRPAPLYPREPVRPMVRRRAGRPVLRLGRRAPTRHRLDLGGNRRVNSILHIVHVTQARCHQPAKEYLARRATANQSKRSARRSHKRQLANVIIRRMWSDADRLRQLPTHTKIAAA